jgi:copper chaperone CopZ
MPAIELKSADIHCGGCAASIDRALGALAGVQAVSVNVEGQVISVEFDAPASEEQIKSAVEDAGFAIAN